MLSYEVVTNMARRKGPPGLIAQYLDVWIVLVDSDAIKVAEVTALLTGEEKPPPFVYLTDQRVDRRIKKVGSVLYAFHDPEKGWVHEDRETFQKGKNLTTERALRHAKNLARKKGKCAGLVR